MLYPLKYFVYGDGISLKDFNNLQNNERTTFINLNRVETVSGPIPFQADCSKKFVQVRMAASSNSYFVSEREGLGVITKMGLVK